MNGKKKSWVLGSLILIMACMVLGYAALVRVNEAKTELAQEEENIVLYTLNTDTASRIEVKNEKGEVFLEKKEDSWFVEGEEEFPLDQSYISGMLSALSSIQASGLVKEDGENMEEYGLKKPAMEITITLSDGTSAKLTLGDEVPIQGGRYGLADDGTTVYVFDSSYYTSFDYSLNDLMTVEAGPEFEPGSVTSLILDNGKGSYFEAKKDESLAWTINGPYSQPVRGDAQSLSGLFSSYSGLSFGECVEYDSKDSTIYGIQKDGAKIEVQYEEEITGEADGSKAVKTRKETFTLFIGDPDEAGNYYVQPKGSSYVYKMDEDTVESLLYVTAFSYISPYIVNETIDDLESISIEIKENKKKSTISIKETGTKDEEGSETVEYTVKRNKKKWDYDEFSAAFTNLSQLTFSGEMKEENPSGKRVYATVLLKGRKNTKTITFLEYDKANFYQVLIDGEGIFLTEIKPVQSVLEEFSGE